MCGKSHVLPSYLICLKSTGTMVYRYHHLWMIASGFVLFLLLGCADSTPNINKLLRAAEQGDAEAQFEMGDMYREGVNVEADGVDEDAVEASKRYTLAEQSFRKAADQGDAGGEPGTPTAAPTREVLKI